MCLNEERMLPFFFRHYEPYVDRYFIYDNGSTDDSLALIAEHPRAQVVPFETEGDSFVDCARRLLDHVWKGSRGAASWVIVCEVDEHLHHPEFITYLDRCLSTGVTAIRAIGFDMVSRNAPPPNHLLFETVTRGLRSGGFDKLAVFRPDCIDETCFSVGRHTASPIGNVVFEPVRQVKLLHYKYLGVDYVIGRNATLSKGLRTRDIDQSWGQHYFRTADATRSDFTDLEAVACHVPGLGQPPHASKMTLAEQHLIIIHSGLFDSKWYEEAYGNVAQSGVEPAWHFCQRGWREGRQPNEMFETNWYLDRYASSLPSDVNPLVDYILDGEVLGRMPNSGFDPLIYKFEFKLAARDSALRHCLVNGRRSFQRALPA